jgi:hypothetical protein
MGELSEKLRGLRFMQKGNTGSADEREVSFSTFFCKKSLFSFNTKQKMPKDPSAQKKMRGLAGHM